MKLVTYAAYPCIFMYIVETLNTTIPTNNNGVRTSNKKQALKDIEHTAQVIAGYIALARPRGTKEWKTLEVLYSYYSIKSISFTIL